MKPFLAFFLALVVSLPATAVSGSRVKYVGGTAPGVKAGIVGRLDTTSESSLIFESQGQKVAIHYASIESFQYKDEVARHLGVLPFIAVRLLKVRQRRHFFRISYRDPSDDPAQLKQVVILEVPKNMSCTLQAVLEARAPQAGQPAILVPAGTDPAPPQGVTLEELSQVRHHCISARTTMRS